ncbi:short chain dehydrogenase/reductase [Stipitochalara longipes BDJ]|nr:short chain dehydrogenase/reductase [Stipitochalara longipes BDJ]
MHTYLILLALIGTFWTSLFAWKIISFIYIYFVRRSSILRYHHHHHNSSAPPWAVITGSSDGIGKQYAYEFARRNFNIVLHGRNATKLHHVRTELHDEFPHLSFRVIVGDASKSGPETTKHIQEIVDSLRDLHITVLVNNVGTGNHIDGSVYSEIQDTPTEDIDYLINLNARFPAQFTRVVVPLLLSHGGPALILTMGSMSEFGMPQLSLYSATKCFDMVFSKALRREMILAGRTNVEVLGIMAGSVTGVSHNKSQSTLLMPDSAAFARAAIERVGCGEDVVAATWVQGVVYKMVGAMPLFLRDRSLEAGVKGDMEMRERNAKKE